MQTELIDLFQSGCALIVGTVDGANVPAVTRAWGVDVIDGPGPVTLRVLLPADDTTTLGNISATGRLAVTATDLDTLRSVQAKGRVRVVRPADPSDEERGRRFTAELIAGLEAVDGTPPALSRRLVPARLTVAEVDVDELYDQTPGPTAGQVLSLGSP